MIHNTFKILLLSVSVWCAPFRKFCTPSSSSFSWYLLRHSWSLSVNVEENITQDEILVYYQHLWPHTASQYIELASYTSCIKPCPNAMIMIEKVPYFFDQMLWLLFEGGIYFIGKPVDSNNGWIRYMQAIQLGLIDAGTACTTCQSYCQLWKQVLKHVQR